MCSYDNNVLISKYTLYIKILKISPDTNLFKALQIMKSKMAESEFQEVVSSLDPELKSSRQPTKLLEVVEKLCSQKATKNF